VMQSKDISSTGRYGRMKLRTPSDSIG